MEELLNKIVTICNNNSGFLTLIIFIATILFGWTSGLFRAILRKPKFKIALIEGPTFCCTFETGRQHNGYDAHMTAFVLYLYIKNVGAISSSIDKISVGYHNNSLKYYFLWFWLNKQTISLQDFSVKIGENVKVYPFLTQKSIFLQSESQSFLQIGKSANGIVYFEQGESWGSYKPIENDGKVKVKVKVLDVFGRSYSKIFKIPNIKIEEARKFNPDFGLTYETLHQKDKDIP